jgi:hypothetical protein
MNTGQESKCGRAGVYASACDSHGYRVLRDGVVVKAYRLDPICYLLTAEERVAVSAQFAAYDIRNERFMLL